MFKRKSRERQKPVSPVKMPVIRRSTSALSGRYQRRAKWVIGGGLVLAGLYTLAGPFETVGIFVSIVGYRANLIALLAGAAFLVASALHGFRLIYKPESKWYSSRGLTEEIKSFAWRYAVGGKPYGKDQEGLLAIEDDYSKTLHRFLDKARKEHLALPIPIVNDPIEYITSTMKATREASLQKRQEIYAQFRILDQQNFYQDRTNRNRNWAIVWNIVLIIIEVGFAVVAGLRAINVIPFDFFGVAGTLVAGIAAWVQFSQYRSLADLYTDMAFELGEFHRKCLQPVHPWDEERWSVFVDNVENFLEAEHGAWRKLVDPDRTDSLLAQ